MCSGVHRGGGCDQKLRTLVHSYHNILMYINEETGYKWIIHHKLYKL